MDIEHAALPLPASDTVSPAEVKQSLDSLLRVFDEFKNANDERLAELEKHHSADVVLRDKVERLNAVIGDLSSQARRPVLEGSSAPAHTAPDEHKAAFLDYVRSGQVAPALETRDWSASTDADGGYAVLPELEAGIAERLRLSGTVRGLASVRAIGRGNSYKKLYVPGELAASWVSETAARPKTATPAFAEVRVPVHEQYANPAASAALLDDSAVDIGAWLTEALHTAFMAAEDAAFVRGNGTNKPKGILAYGTKAPGAADAEKLVAVKTGVASALPTDPADFLVDFAYSLPSQYRQNAHWMMTRKTAGALRKIKDKDGRHIWQPNLAAGQPPTLLGAPVAESEHMDEIGAGAFPILFGDLRAGYLIVDRRGMQILRDPFSNKPHVMFYTTRRVGGAVQDFAALQLVKVAA